MSISRLDHVSLRTRQLQRMIEWYDDILGIKSGFRPQFSYPGAWLYVGEIPVVHLVGTDDDGAGAEQALKLEHFAFAANDLKAFEARLKAKNIPFRRSEKPDINLILINLWDPDGNHIHVDFPFNE